MQNNRFPKFIPFKFHVPFSGPRTKKEKNAVQIRIALISRYFFFKKKKKNHRQESEYKPTKRTATITPSGDRNSQLTIDYRHT